MRRPCPVCRRWFNQPAGRSQIDCCSHRCAGKRTGSLEARPVRGLRREHRPRCGCGGRLRADGSCQRCAEVSL